MPTLTPAYNRDYKSKAEVLEDWVAGKYFVLNTHRGDVYCSIRDRNSINGIIIFRYNNLTKVCNEN